MEDYAGSVSEMTAINQYIYHHITFEDNERIINVVDFLQLGLVQAVFRRTKICAGIARHKN